MGAYFGTDGVRGTVGEFITEELAYALGKGACAAFKKVYGIAKPVFVVGQDTRISCEMLNNALCRGIFCGGGDVVIAGVIPTPAIAVLIKKYETDAGIVISASHNPYTDNGIKFFGKTGCKLDDALEDEIENNMSFEGFEANIEVSSRVKYIPSGVDYSDYLLSRFPGLNLSGLKIVLDCANGATYETAPRVFEKLNADYIVINDKPDGININEKCGSTHLTALSEAVKANEADFGVAFDGDGDRMLAVDENGCEVDGDMIMYLFALELKKRENLNDDTLVATTMSNLGLELALKRAGIKLERTDVGDRYVIARIKEKGYILGGEQSGHIINMLVNSTGDGMASAMMLAMIIKKSEATLSELLEYYEKMPQVLLNTKVSSAKKYAYKTDSQVLKLVSDIEKKYSGLGRLVLRNSGTEALVRVMIEGPDQQEISQDAKRLAELISEISN